jgi:D-glycero-D-manno-heptose 1,7-bisphosphate phosphatase
MSCQVSEIGRELNANLLRIAFSEGQRDFPGPAIFIDRDGVINCRRPGDYVLEWSQFVFTPGIRPALHKLSTLGLPMIVISNQAGVGRGLLDLPGLREITTQMFQTLAADGTVLSAAYYCPHTPDEDCVCRKPKPGLLYKAAEDFNVDLSRSIFIGDSNTDVQAARAAGCASVLFESVSDSHLASPMDHANAPSAGDLVTLVERYLQIAKHT